jgi:3-deoxy-D-manno-octulosonic-acid transferase
MFSSTYTVSLLTLHSLLSPIIFAISFKKKYRNSIPARFFLWKNRTNLENRYWFHGCSLGEINAIKPFLKKFPEDTLLTTTTETGFNSGKKSGFETRYLPFEHLLSFWRGKPKKLIVLEAELWYLLFRIGKRKGAETILLSGRISERSFPKYMKWRWFYKRIFQNIDVIYAQSEIDKSRFEKLGAGKVKVLGNIKLLKSKSSQNLDIPKDRKVFVGASTHKGDEETILNAYPTSERVLIVPRHKERFDEVWKIVLEFGEKRGVSTSRYSESHSFQADVVLVDTIGMLIDIYAKSDVVILGGGFYDGIGGHNPVEPASFQNIVISGKYAFNQLELFPYIDNLKIVEKIELKEVLQNINSLHIAKVSQDIDFQKIEDTLKK